MPYIKKEDRAELDAVVDMLPQRELSAGEMNYLLTRIIDRECSGSGLNYTKINTVMGVLCCVGQEFYRRVAVPYEDRKIEQNGDVYTLRRSDPFDGAVCSTRTTPEQRHAIGEKVRSIATSEGDDHDVHS